MSPSSGSGSQASGNYSKNDATSHNISIESSTASCDNSNLALCTPVTRPNCSALKMKAPRTFDRKHAHSLSVLAEIWYTSKINGKAIPLQVWTGPEGSRRLRLPDFMTFIT
jgi:hypothetical protein